MSIFTDDVFISYSHQSNKDGWVDAFHAELLIQLADVLPREPTVWRDASLSGGDIFSDEIDDRLRSTKVLVSVLAPPYVTSAWCLRELAVFHKAAELHHLGLRIGNKSRIIKAIKVDVPREDHPPEFSGTTGFQFFVEDKQAGEDKRYTHDKNAPDYRQFRQEVARIAGHIKVVVQAIDKESVSQIPRSSKPAVFLAESIAELNPFRELIRSELETRGYPVLPGPKDTFGYVLPDYENTICEYLKQAKFSIHLVGRHYGLIPEVADGQPERSITELQNEWAAKQRGKQNFESLIWIPEDVETQDKRQQTFLDYLLKRPEAQVHAEPSRMSFESFKQKIVDKLEKLEKRIEASQRPPSKVKKIYLMCDKRDYESIGVVKKFLFNKGFNVFLSPSLNGEGPATNFHDKCLKSCDATLIYYGATDDAWVDLMNLDVMEAPKLRESGDFLCKALFLADPQIEYLIYGPEILKHDGNSVESSLMPFIECLQGDGPNGGVHQ